MEKSVFETLFEINVNDHVEKKNGLSYLSWPYAWAEVKKCFPDANYKVYETESGCIYCTDGCVAAQAELRYELHLKAHIVGTRPKNGR